MKKCQCQTKQPLVPARHWYGLLHPLWEIPPALAKWFHWWSGSESVVVSQHVIVTEQVATEPSGFTC